MSNFGITICREHIVLQGVQVPAHWMGVLAAFSALLPPARPLACHAHSRCFPPDPLFSFMPACRTYYGDEGLGTGWYPDPLTGLW